MQLHRATKEELHDVAVFINDRFWGLEQHTLLARGLSDPKGILCRSTEASLMLFHKKGDVHVCGGEDMGACWWVSRPGGSIC